MLVLRPAIEARSDGQATLSSRLSSDFIGRVAQTCQARCAVTLGKGQVFRGPVEIAALDQVPAAWPSLGLSATTAPSRLPARPRGPVVCATLFPITRKHRHTRLRTCLNPSEVTNRTALLQGFRFDDPASFFVPLIIQHQ